MVNRSIQAKILKMKKRGRFAVFSGKVSKYAEHIMHGRYEGVTTTPDGDEVPSGKTVVIAVGKISLSKAVISAGRGPDAERVAEYYARLNSFSEPIPATKQGHFTTPMAEMMLRYQEILNETKERRINLEDSHLGRLDLFFRSSSGGKQEWFFVDIDYTKNVLRRSRPYGSKAFAIAKMEHGLIAWVETLGLP